MAAGYPSGFNTFVPSHEASGGLIVGFSRNPKSFKVNQYIKLVPVKKSVGYYLTITAEEAARVINANLSDFVWPDGAEAPMGNDNLESFAYTKFQTARYVFPFNLGQKAVDQADWQIVQVHGGIAAQKAMTARTVGVWNTIGTGANWGANTDTATNVAGGQLDVATTANPYIKKLFRSVAETILKATLGVVKREDLVCVLNPHTAGLISESAELIDHFKNNQFALAQIRQDAPNQNGMWGLPDVLYGVKIVVEDAVRVTSKKGATKATGYVCPAQTLTFMARPGGLVGMEGIPEFSTAQVFCYEEFTTETKSDPDNRRTQGRVVEDYVPALVAPAAGYMVTSATAT